MHKYCRANIGEQCYLYVSNISACVTIIDTALIIGIFTSEVNNLGPNQTYFRSWNFNTWMFSSSAKQFIDILCYIYINPVLSFVSVVGKILKRGHLNEVMGSAFQW